MLLSEELLIGSLPAAHPHLLSAFLKTGLLAHHEDNLCNQGIHSFSKQKLILSVVDYHLHLGVSKELLSMFGENSVSYYYCLGKEGLAVVRS